MAAFVSLLAALGLTLSARPLLETTSYVVFLAAVMFSSWYGGLTPGLLVVLLSVLAIDRYIGSAEASTALGAGAMVRLGVFLLVAAAINHLSRSRNRAEAALRESHEELEARVAERTSALHRLSAQILRLQDEERRRTSRLLHETVAQSLAALKMELSVIKRSRSRDSDEAREALDEALSLANTCIREVRTVSYLLHPPLLDEVGLSCALQWYAAGFERRSGITTRLELPPELDRLPRDIETTVFRIVQECLTNIHRHSGSDSASIRIETSAEHLSVEIRDQGRGIPAAAPSGAGSPGVGIMEMRERAKELGGSLSIHSSESGTGVTAILPLAGVQYSSDGNQPEGVAVWPKLASS
ncbi:MAG TPA: sensor histidine kinase [Terriglobia bacterium]|nr:sensor histidine kinase [Terriglobia bacterium]